VNRTDPSTNIPATVLPIDRVERAKRRGDTREMLVRTGVEIFTERGFQATGIDEIRQRVNVPKGSFYHFFPSKKAFGLAVIDEYERYFERKLARSFDNSRTPLDRLAAFAEDAMRGMRKFNYQRGCLIGNLGQELGGLDDDFRDRLEKVLQSWQHSTQRVLEDAVAAGQLPARSDCKALAEFFWIGWEGAILRAKLTRSDEPLNRFYALFVSTARCGGLL